ncbi:hypothetical protein CALCODRAFT_496522 [Calocera cornea HHB12733]|uniref:Uncharacterized protein n=1 Tax=Calocera cornea HHB12733 TaxID=1353952 RepID=A0A165FQ46_9BASI|nr:hypothetical protein CALCODRAFT_496522 [Calocera cornea HHB12733]
MQSLRRLSLDSTIVRFSVWDDLGNTTLLRLELPSLESLTITAPRYALYWLPLMATPKLVDLEIAFPESGTSNRLLALPPRMQPLHNLTWMTLHYWNRDLSPQFIKRAPNVEHLRLRLSRVARPARFSTPGNRQIASSTPVGMRANIDNRFHVELPGARRTERASYAKHSKRSTPGPSQV